MAQYRTGSRGFAIITGMSGSDRTAGGSKRLRHLGFAAFQRTNICSAKRAKQKPRPPANGAGSGNKTRGPSGRRLALRPATTTRVSTDVFGGGRCHPSRPGDSIVCFLYRVCPKTFSIIRLNCEPWLISRFCASEFFKIADKKRSMRGGIRNQLSSGRAFFWVAASSGPRLAARN